MTPPASAAHTAHPARPARRRSAARPPRRVSGPARPARGAAPAVAASPPLGLRLARAAASIPDARLLDRLVRGRAWIAIVAAGLLGIVFMQVSMLRLNAGISRAITTAETLQRQNATLRGDISELDAGERILDAAGALGMILPPAGQVNYLDARKADGRAAARAIRPPDPVKPRPGAAATTASAPAGAPRATVTAAAATPAAPAPATAAPSTTGPTPTATAPASTPTAPAPAAGKTTAPAPTPPPATTPQAAPAAPATTAQGGQ